MRFARLFFALALGATAVCSAPACSSGDVGGGREPAKTPAQKFCDVLASYVEDCGPRSPCDQALLADCADVTGMLNDSYLKAATTCMKEGNAPTACLTSSLGAIEASEAHHEFAAKVCKDCAFGVAGCEDVFFSEGDGETQVVGNLVLPLGDSLVTQIGEECAKGLTCLPQFPSCVQGVLAKRALPTETIACLLDPPAVTGQAAEPCEELSSGSEGATSGGGAGASSSGPSGSGGTGNGSGSGTPSGSGPSSSSSSGSGGYSGTCPETTTTYYACNECCYYEDPYAADELLVAVLDECACKIASPCNEVCEGACTTLQLPADCGTCIQAQLDGNSACAATANDACSASPSCAPWLECTSACASTCTFDAECPEGFICEAGGCKTP